MTVYFVVGIIYREIGTAETSTECYKIINNFLKERNYKSPYWRISKYDDHEWIDVGSHTQFFEIYEKPLEEKKWDTSQ